MTGATQTQTTRAQAAPKRMSNQAIEDAMKALETGAGHLTIERKSVAVGNNQLSYWRFSSTSGTSPKKIVTLVGGIHAREWEPPEGLVAFAALLGTVASDGVIPSATPSDFGVTYLDGRSFEKRLNSWFSEIAHIYQIRKQLQPSELTAIAKEKDLGKRRTLWSQVIWSKWFKPFFDICELHVIPNANAAGREFSLQTGQDHMWRGNRNTGYLKGVDINRNFPLPGKHTKWTLYDATLAQTLHHDELVTLDKSHGNSSEVFAGEPVLETETDLLREYVDTTNPNALLDFHTCGGAVVAPWGCVGTCAKDDQNPNVLWSALPKDGYKEPDDLFQSWSEPIINRHFKVGWKISREITRKTRPRPDAAQKSPPARIFPVLYASDYTLFATNLSRKKSLESRSKVRQRWLDLLGSNHAAYDADGDPVVPQPVPGSLIDYVYATNFDSGTGAPLPGKENIALSIELGVNLKQFDNPSDDFHEQVCDDLRTSVLFLMERLVRG